MPNEIHLSNDEWASASIYLFAVTPAPVYTILTKLLSPSFHLVHVFTSFAASVIRPEMGQVQNMTRTSKHTHTHIICNTVYSYSLYMAKVQTILPDEIDI